MPRCLACGSAGLLVKIIIVSGQVQLSEDDFPIDSRFFSKAANRLGAPKPFLGNQAKTMKIGWLVSTRAMVINGRD